MRLERPSCLQPPSIPGRAAWLLLATCTVPGLPHLLLDVWGGTTTSVHPMARPTCFTRAALSHTSSLINLLQAGGDRPGLLAGAQGS